MESFSLTGDDALPEIADVIIKFSLFFLGFTKWKSQVDFWEERVCLSHKKHQNKKKREKQEKKETDLIVIDSLTTQAQRHAERIEKSMDIVPGTDDSLSSKASKKSTRDWEKTKEHAIRWAFSTGKAAWTFGTTFLVLVVPLIVELHREEQMMEMEKEQMGVLADQQQQQQQQL